MTASGNNVLMTGLAAGSVSATSLDAVNGAQLYSLSTSTSTGLSTATSGIASLSTGLNTTQSTVASLSTGLGTVTNNLSNLSTSVTNGTIGPVQQTGTTNKLALVAPGATGANPGAAQVLTNVASGQVSATSTDAINGGQLYSLSASTSTGLSTVNSNVASLSTGVNSLSTGLSTTNSTVSNLASSLSTTQNTATGVANGTVGLVQQAGGIGAGNNNAITVGATTGGTVVDFANASGATRKLTNVSAGALNATSTDAVNGSQLYATNQQVTQNATDITTLTNQVNSGGLGLVQQDSTTQNLTVGKNTNGSAVDFAGTAGTRVLTGVSAGQVNAASTDAVNGGQLYSLSASTSTGLSTVTSNVASLSTGLGNVTNNLSTLSTSIANGMIGPVQQSGTANALALVAPGGTGSNPGAAQVLTNVANGQVSATSTDAVNGGQFYSLSTSTSTGLSTVTSNVASLSTGLNTTNSSIASLSTSTSTGLSTVTSNVASLSTGLETTNSNIATLSASTSTGLNTVSSNVASLSTGLDTTNSNVASLSTGLGTVTNNLSTLSTSITNGTIGPIQQTGTANTLALVAPGGTGVNPGAAQVLTNVAAGQVSQASTDAINGGQFYSLSTSTSTGLSTLTSNVASLSTSVTTVSNDVTNLSTSIANGNIGPVQQTSVTNQLALVAPGSNGTNPGTAQGLTNVAAGNVTATSTDAVNGSQLFAVQQQVNSLSTTVTNIKLGDANENNVNPGNDNSNASGINSTATGANSNASGDNATATGEASNASGENSTATGQGASASGDNSTAEGQGAIASGKNSKADGENARATGDNSTALGQGTQASGDNSVATGQGSTASGGNSTALGQGSTASGSSSTALGSNAKATGDNTVALGANSVASEPDTVSVGSQGNERRITNVAPGINGTDAANMNQLWGVQSSVNQVARTAYSGVAAATALTMIPDVDPGKTIAVGIGAATYQGYGASAIGVTARITANLKVRAGAGISGNGTTYGAGMSYQW